MSPRLIIIALAAAGALLAQDPPTRIARLNYVSGSVSFQPGGVNDWVAAEVNRPLTVGDQLFTDQGARAELHVPGAAFRLGDRTAFQFLNLDDRNVQVRLSEGTLNVRVRNLLGENFEVDTPDLAFTISRPGDYRIDAFPDQNQTHVTVRSGQGVITSNAGSFTVDPSQQAVFNQSQYAVYAAPGYDEFGQWALDRDRREDRVVASRYVSPYAVGYEDLDQYGSWRNVGGYGQMWFPRVSSGWAPYHDGSWTWVDPWGWTWVDSQPWGFCPSHYGRWAYVNNNWGWLPGPVAVQPVYSPAFVAWVGGASFGVSLGFGSGPAVGWFPLGPRDVYIPAYGASQNYIRRINVTNTTIVNNTYITNVYNNYRRTGNIPVTDYANRSVPGAVIAMPQSALVSARPVQQFGRRVAPAQIAQIRVADPTPRVAPQVVSVLGRAATANVPRPAVAVVTRPVVARATPARAAAPFAARQPLLTKNPGHPLPIQQQHQAARAVQPVAPVHVVTQARAVRPEVRNTVAPNAPQRMAGRAVAPPARAEAPQQNQPGRAVTPQRAGEAPARAQAEPARPVAPPARAQSPQRAYEPPARAQAEPARPAAPPARAQAPERAYQPPARVQAEPARPAAPPARAQAPERAYQPPARVQAEPARPVAPPRAQAPQRAYEPPARVQAEPARPPAPPARAQAPERAYQPPARVQAEPARPAAPPARAQAPERAYQPPARVQAEPARPAPPPARAQAPARAVPQQGEASRAVQRPAPAPRAQQPPPRVEAQPARPAPRVAPPARSEQQKAQENKSEEKRH